MILPRWVLPLLDLAAPAFLFRAGANGLKFIFSTLQSRVLHSSIIFSMHVLIKSSEMLRPASAAVASR